MICLFLNTNDTPGVWLFHSLVQSGVRDIIMISAEELAYAGEFTCETDNGNHSFSIQLQNGVELNNNNVRASLNRINYLPTKLAQQFIAADQDYVAHEQAAVFTFFLNILPNQLFNTSSGRGLCGQYRSRFEWMQIARLAGFETIEIVYENFTLYGADLADTTGEITILYFNGKCFGHALLQKPHLAEICTRFAQLAGENILEISLREIENTVMFTRANTVPTFKSANEDFVNELKMLLQ